MLVQDSENIFLAIECATAVSSVALYKQESLIARQEYLTGRLHASRITPMIAGMLRDIDLTAAELSAVMVTMGPGSYTGLRVGVSTAKGLCTALNIPLLSVTSLEGLAWQAKSMALYLDAWICPMIDARRMEAYIQIFDQNIEAKSSPEARVIDAQSLQELLEQRKVIFLGDGMPKCRALLSQSPNAYFLPEAYASAASLGVIVWEKFKKKDFEDLIRFEPFYLKDFIATPKKKKLL